MKLMHVAECHSWKSLAAMNVLAGAGKQLADAAANMDTV